MISRAQVGLILLALLVSEPAFAQTDQCGPAPSLPTTASSEESIKGQLEGQAKFLSGFIGNAGLGGQGKAARKTDIKQLTFFCRPKGRLPCLPILHNRRAGSETADF